MTKAGTTDAVQWQPTPLMISSRLLGRHAANSSSAIDTAVSSGGAFAPMVRMCRHGSFGTGTPLTGPDTARAHTHRINPTRSATSEACGPVHLSRRGNGGGVDRCPFLRLDASHDRVTASICSGDIRRPVGFLSSCNSSFSLGIFFARWSAAVCHASDIRSFCSRLNRAPVPARMTLISRYVSRQKCEGS